MLAGVIIFVLVAIALIYFVVQVRHMHSRLKITLIIMFVLFLYLSASIVISKNNIEVKSLNGMITAGKAYFHWIGNVIDNTKTIVGNAVKMDWSVSSTVK